MSEPPSSPFSPGNGDGVPASLNSIATVPDAFVPAAFVWAGADGKPCSLCDSELNPMGLSIHFNPSDKTILFRLHCFLDLLGQKGSPKARTSIYLYIQADRIQSIIVLDDSSRKSDEVQEELRNRLGPGPMCLQLALHSPADLVVPSLPLWPTKKAHRAMLHSVGLLAEQTALTVYLRKDRVWSSSHLASLCRAVSKHELGPNREVADLSKLYNGHGGRLLRPDSLFSSNPVPPSYGEVEPGPPGSHFYEPIEGPSFPKKRQRTSSTDEGTRPNTANIAILETICKTMLAENQGRIEESQRTEREQLNKRISVLEEALRAGLGQLEERVIRVEEQCEELSAQVDEIQEFVGEHDRHVDERVDLEVEDRVLGIKMDLEDFVKDELSGAAEAIKEQITRANVFIDFNDE
ncbi:hypothetical protein VM1G_10878 [Cytospora mali]|uniref:Uncharacterized protein n=1 Tax=Cytospora mali TaxID=578113 RepID=A0A194VIY2_CYTMA|nr:hypothetical protein VM1G_10878 [Valsa mali]